MIIIIAILILLSSSLSPAAGQDNKLEHTKDIIPTAESVYNSESVSVPPLLNHLSY
jgi:hypothetical protein